jgi:hypothetical protein
VLYYKSLHFTRGSSLCPCLKPLPDDEDGKIHHHQNHDDEEEVLNQEAKKILEVGPGFSAWDERFRVCG